MEGGFSPFEGVALRLDWPQRAIGLISLTRPRQMNTLTFELLDEFGRALDIASTAPTRALVITGVERAFCGGAHLHYFAGPGASLLEPFDVRDRYVARIAATFDRLEALPFPTIAAINGYALGGGCELALSCDLRVLSDAAMIGVPEVRLGALAGAGGVQKLVRHVGRSTALDWTLRGLHVDARTVQRHGLCSDVVAAERLLPRSLELACELRRLGPKAVAQSKRCVYVSEDADLGTAQRFGLDALAMLVGSAEWKEGMAAFVERRTPEFDRW